MVELAKSFDGLDGDRLHNANRVAHLVGTLMSKAEPLRKKEYDDFFDLFQTDNDEGIHRAMNGLDPATGQPNPSVKRAWQETVDYITHVPNAKSGLVRYLMRNQDNPEHVQLLKQLVKASGALVVRKVADEFGRLTGQDFREYMAKHYLPHVMGAENNGSADGEVLEDILAHHPDSTSVLSAMKGNRFPVQNVSLLGALANTVYKEDPHRLYEDFKVDQHLIRKLPASAQLGFLAHAMKTHDTSHDARKASLLTSAESMANDLREQMPDFDQKVGDMAKKLNIPMVNPVFQRVAKDAKQPEALGTQIGVRVGSAALRKLRDYIQELGRPILPNELPTGQRWNTITTPITQRDGSVNYVLDWNPLRERNGKISAESVQRYIDNMPVTHFDFSVAPYQGDQMHSKTKPQQVLRLKISDHDMRKLSSTGADRTMMTLADLGRQSGHPVEGNTVGWIRFSTGADGNHLIDETQSDLDTNFESSLRQQLKQHYNLSGDALERAYQQHIVGIRQKFPAAHIDQIKSLVFGKKQSSEILHEAFQEYMRRQGKVGGEYHTHSSTSKAPMANMDMSATLPGHMKIHYEETPKALGATPANYGTLEAETAPQYDHLPNARVHGEKVRKFEE